MTMLAPVAARWLLAGEWRAGPLGMGIAVLAIAVGVALVAEVMPDKARPYALSLLQALSTVGNITAAVTGLCLGHLETSGVLGTLGGRAAWRGMVIIGALPAILVVAVR